jgi:hypothetical protein
MVFESNTIRSPQSNRATTSVAGKHADQSRQMRRASRRTARIDTEMLGTQDASSRTKLTLEDELWLRNALQSRLPIF